MKIIHLVLGKANPERMNGVNKVVHQLAKTQAVLGQKVSVWGIANDLIHNYPIRNFKTVLFQQYSNKTICARLKTAIKDLSKDHIVHIHGAFILEFYQVARLLKKQGVEFVFTPHGAFSKAALQQNKWAKKVYFHLLEKWVIKHAKATQLLGVNELDQLNEMMVEGNKKLIPNGMDLSQLPTDLEPKQKERLTFGFCGRIDINHKGLDLMLKGFKAYLENGGTGKLELIGDGADRLALEELALDLGIQDQIVFHGALFGIKKFHTLHQFDVFLHTSRMEGFPMAVLEAAALSIPCITSEATNINSYIREHNAGIALPNNTPQCIAIAMGICEEFYQCDQLAFKGENARAMVVSTFDWRNIARKLIKTYAA